MKCFKLPPLLDSKTVLIGHIKAKVKQYPELSMIVDDLSIALCDNRSSEEIINLLVCEKSFKNAILKLKIEGHIKQKLGSELFMQVSQIDTSLCAQVTGMLLDLDILSICHLLCDVKLLEVSVLKAKEEYMKFQQGPCKEYFGDKIYPKVLAVHADPKLAAHLTGMLLELEFSDLERLLDNPEDFSSRLNIALKVIQRDL